MQEGLAEVESGKVDVIAMVWVGRLGDGARTAQVADTPPQD